MFVIVGQIGGQTQGSLYSHAPTLSQYSQPSTSIYQQKVHGFSDLPGTGYDQPPLPAAPHPQLPPMPVAPALPASNIARTRMVVLDGSNIAYAYVMVQ